ncbi:hypothetical protein [Nostoc sp. DSM 114160]
MFEVNIFTCTEYEFSGLQGVDALMSTIACDARDLVRPWRFSLGEDLLTLRYR